MTINSSSSTALRQEQLNDTRRAFDSVADEYDGPLGNNLLVQRMRRQLWKAVENRVQPGARLLDMGCGTGIDAVYFGSRGYEVYATDWSPEMAAQTSRRVQKEGWEERVEVRHLGIHEFDAVDPDGFDAIYSNLGVLNCVRDLSFAASQCARLLRPGGILVASVIGRVCPWEIFYYIMRGRFGRVNMRFCPNAVPVSLNGHTVWTRYYTPREFQQPFADWFERAHLRTMNLLLPPPYLIRLYEMFPSFWQVVGHLERAVAILPGIRSMGDHFLIVLTRVP